jgi:hypothetical protein
MDTIQSALANSIAINIVKTSEFSVGGIPVDPPILYFFGFTIFRRGASSIDRNDPGFDAQPRWHRIYEVCSETG